MPTYDMHCDGCGDDLEIVHSIHDFPLPTIHERSEQICGPLVQVLSAPVIHGIGASGARKKQQTQREVDSEAYRRLRKNGVQPKAVKGSAEIEQRAGETHEVERDVVFQDRKFASRLTRAMADVPA